MSSNAQKFEPAIKQALELVALQKGDRFSREIAVIILTNQDKGRIQFFLNKDKDCQVEEYVWHVAALYEQWQPYLHRLQVLGDTAVWQPLYIKLQKWAYNHLLRKSFPGTPTTLYQHAVDCAGTAATKLLNATFPYDTAFDPWAHVLLQNVVAKHVEKEFRRINKQVVEIDEIEGWGELFADPTALDAKKMIEYRLDLLSAIEQLTSEARKEIIIRHYFEGQSFKEIALSMHKSPNALYKLHFDTLQALRKILKQTRDKYE